MLKDQKNRPTVLRVMRGVVMRYFQDRVPRSSAELSYYLLFSLFPALIFLNAAISMLHLSTDMLTENLNVVLPAQASEIITAYLSYIQGLDTKVLLYASLFLTVYAISRAVVSLMNSISRAYRIPQQGLANLALGIAVTVALLIGIVLFLVLIMISESLLLQISQYITVPGPLIRIWGTLRLTVAPLLMLLLVASLYAVVGHGHIRFWQTLPGAGASVVLWFLLTSGFSYYVNHVARYSLLYGSLASIMILMVWFHLTGSILIMGAEFNHVLSQVRAEKAAQRKGGTS